MELELDAARPPRRRTYHGKEREHFNRDRRRDLDLKLMGWDVHRFDGDMVRSDPYNVVKIAASLAGLVTAQTKGRKRSKVNGSRPVLQTRLSVAGKCQRPLLVGTVKVASPRSTRPGSARPVELLALLAGCRTFGLLGSVARTCSSAALSHRQGCAHAQADPTPSTSAGWSGREHL